MRELTRQELERENEILRMERNHARQQYEHAVRLITSIHALLYPPPLTTDDGRTMVFRPKDLDPHELMQNLSDRIRSLPDALAKPPEYQGWKDVK